MSTTSTISCSVFRSLTSSSKGTVLSITTQQHIEILNSLFYSITSSNWPGVIYALKPTLSISHLYFELCHSQGRDQTYGRVACIEDSPKTKIEQITCFLCYPDKQDRGDSTIVARKSSVECTYVNFSFCSSSQYGCSSISSFEHISECYFSYMNIVHSYELSAFEVYETKKTVYLSKSNVVNSSMCLGIFSVLNIKKLICKNCIFYQSSQSINSQQEGALNMEFTDCFCDKEYPGVTGLSRINSLTTFGFIVDRNIMCDHVVCKSRNHQRRVVSLFVLALFIFK